MKVVNWQDTLGAINRQNIRVFKNKSSTQILKIKKQNRNQIETLRVLSFFFSEINNNKMKKMKVWGQVCNEYASRERPYSTLSPNENAFLFKKKKKLIGKPISQ